MKRPLIIVATILCMVGAFIGGAIFVDWRDSWYGAFDTDQLATKIIGGELALGAAWDEVPLVKPKAESKRRKWNGDEERTAIYQDKDFLVLVNATNGRIDRLGVWKYGSADAEFYADSNDKKPNKP